MAPENLKRIAKPNPRRKPEPAGAFKPGDLVQLKSGGFQMTVYGLVDTCGIKGEHVELLWTHGTAGGSSYRDICRDVVPVACLKRADLDDNISF
ncbi:DUF2158 domain-containing protein [Rhizobium sp. PL01]|uniref:DUF2158 domain-containing protein n=1 Tax=Rhizobium sp. PL01 TaxID=3085631 RepID=UPI002981F2F5|nr:DUF2158 domain-containing protein [Rhizobium sp. PL01]MDW5313740.1 DUF2158 domain-containing protein [Rhizobium sp. PL01]